MKIAVINLPTMRPTMPPYSIGILGEIIYSVNSYKCDIFDFNLSFWDKLFSKEFSIRANCISSINSLDKNITLDDAKKAVKDSCSSHDLLIKAMERLSEQVKIVENLYEVKINFGEILYEDKILNVENMIDMCQNQEKNIYYRFLKEEIDKNKIINYDMVAISIMCKEQLLPALTFSKLMDVAKNVKIILGGAFVNRFPQKFKNKKLLPFWDNILIGEAESTIPYCIKLIKQNRSDEYKVIYQKNVIKALGKENIICRQYDTYYGGVDVKAYYNLQAIMPIMASRSCYYHGCAFCDNAFNYLGNKEVQTPERVVEQMEEFEVKYGIQRFCFIDDCLSPSFVNDLCMLLIKKRKKYKWFANMRFSLETQKREFIHMMALAGCKEIFLGLESYSGEELYRMKKGIKKEWVLPTITAMKAEGITTYISVMIGYPGETDKDFNITKEFLFSNSNLIDMIDVNIFKQTPNCKVKNGYINEEETNVNFLNSSTSLIDSCEGTNIYNRYNVLKNWAQENDKEPTYWKRNCIMK